MTKSTGKRIVSRRGATPEERLMLHVVKTSTCWNWVGSKARFGHGKINIDGRYVPVHRVAWEIFRGPIGEYIVCHKCDNPACVNPEHLFLGDQRANMDDMRSKGRHAYGEKHGRAKITAAIVREIRSSRESAKIIAERFGISRPSVSLIRTRKNWPHIK